MLDIPNTVPDTLEGWVTHRQPKVLVYLCVRTWLSEGPPPLLRFGDASLEARDAARAWAISFRHLSRDSRTPLGVAIDGGDGGLLGPFRQPSPELVEGIQYAIRETLDRMGVEVAIAAEDWPTVAELDDLEMLAVEWCANAVQGYSSPFQMTRALTRMVPMSRRHAVKLITTWKAIMSLAMTRSKAEARAEAELQLLEAASDAEATPSVRAGTTKAIAGLHGLGKEDRSVSLEGQIMDLLMSASDEPLPPGPGELPTLRGTGTDGEVS